MTHNSEVLAQKALDKLKLSRGAKVKATQSLSGGCINLTQKVDLDDGRAYVVKWNESKSTAFFELEQRGLDLLHSTNTLKVPYCYGVNEVGGMPFILLEYHGGTTRVSDFWEVFGRQLAQLHQVMAEQHGLDYDNTIGAAPQSNRQHDSWIDFFREERLKYQANICKAKGLLSARATKGLEQLYPKLPNLIPELPPSLMHGDLWSGNYITTNDGRALAIDPAVYYGSREMEVAFTQMFGGYDPRFYAAYNEQFPLEEGFDKRVDLYNLYSLLVHLNLFGGGYAMSVERTIDHYVR